MALTRWSKAAPWTLGACLVSTPASAGDQDFDYQRLVARPHTIASLEGGIIALPDAPISPSQRGGSTPFGSIGKGDATLITGVTVVFRVTRDWAFGAGFMLAPLPTSDTQYGGNAALPRSHARSYFTWGVEARWLPLRYKFLEGWVGASLGGAVVADRFNTNAGDPEPTILGKREVTIRSEGFAAGALLGADWLLTDRIVLGITGRAFEWFLRSNQLCSPIGDCSTLSGERLALEFGLNIGYRIPL